MAEIKIIGNIETVDTINRFKEEDLAIISSRNERNSFGLKEDYIEYFVYDAGGSLLQINYDYVDFKSSPKVGLDENGEIKYIEIDPIGDLQNLGYSSGELVSQYNFFRRKISNSSNESLFIKEISPNRTELRIGSAELTNEQIEAAALSLISEINSSTYYKTYLANFGVNQQVVIVNVALNKATENYEIFLKLYEPLPGDLSEKDTFWLVDEIIEPYVFDINLDRLIIPDALPQIGGPNFDIELPDKNTITTQYQSYTDLLTNTSGSTYQQFLSFISSQSIDINVDYTDLNNFVKFSSAKKRIETFYNKVSDIETYQASVTAFSSTSSLSAEAGRLSASINDIISNFDGFEYYLYFESSSLISSVDYYIAPYPKSTATKPFTLYSTSSATATTWLNNALTQSIAYDRDNLNNLEETIPLYLREDDNNANYITYVNMIGHYFDNIWIYLKSVTDLYKSYNNLETGVSKDLAYYALNSLGFKTYNSKESAELLDYIIGNNSGSANFDNNFTSTGSYLNNIPRQDLLAETYKRIYHNISLLFKSKGSIQGINYLNNIFGTTSSILDVREYGGTIKSQYLKGYNPDKIRIANNTITGSLLSPFIGLEMKETASANMLSIDYHKVDIGFSPQNQIDAAVSSSVGSFNIDNYIGDPTLAYSASYSSLNSFKTSTLKSIFTYSFDYSGFIRLIKFFDNTLFKTFKDFSPARNNTSVGIIIRSPQLERNKVAQTKPNVAYQNNQEATYSIASISEDKSYEWASLSGNRAAFYTGELPTTMSSVNYYFEYTNPNPYLPGFPTVKLPTTTGSYVYSYYDNSRFNHTDFNVLLNNVSSSVISLSRKKLSPLYGILNGVIYNSGSITSSIELQDSYLSLSTYQLSRYDGVKTKSLLYNTYTSASTTYEGDQSFGKTAAIDKHVKKLGLYSQIVESQYLPNRNNVRLKYLVDQNGDLTELNQRNKHWEEIQRTFVAGDILDISLFDNQKYGNQKLTDGTKPIFDSGYVYYPVLYFGDTGSNGEIYFENLNGNNAYLFSALNNLSPYNISGSTSLQYPLSSNYVTSLFNAVQEGELYGSTGSSINFPYYKAPETGKYKVDSSLGITMTISGSEQSVTMSFQVYKSSSLGETLLAESTNIFYTIASGGGGGGTTSMTASLTYDSISGNAAIIKITNSTNSNFVYAYGGGSTVYPTLTVPSDGSSVSVTFYITKTNPVTSSIDIFDGTLTINSTVEDSFSYIAGTKISNKPLTGTVDKTSIISIAIVEG